VLFVSVEQPTDQIALRVACLDARVNYQRARMGALHADDYARLVESVGRLEASGLHVEDAGRTVAEIRQHARRLSRTKGLALVAIDYLQLLRAPRAGKGERIAGNRAEELGQMTAGLKALAKELRVPVLVLSQLNRVVEQRADKRPQLGDLRESGAIEQDADVVLLLFRQEYYQQTTDNRGQAELVIAKQRNGPTSTIDLFWQGEYMAFSERAS
jgi:replicative DNA helicase